MQKKIIIPSKKFKPNNSQGCIKVTEEAMDVLVEVVNETGLSVKEVASLIIVQAVNKNLIEYDRGY